VPVPVCRILPYAFIRDEKKSCTAALFSDFAVLFSNPRKRLRTDNGVYLGPVHT
jgi:hypothetical protein